MFHGVSVSHSQFHLLAPDGAALQGFPAGSANFAAPANGEKAVVTGCECNGKTSYALF